MPRKLLFLVPLLLAVSCGKEPKKSAGIVAAKSKTELFTTPAAWSQPQSGLSIIAVPRPNSGTFTTEQATKLRPEFLNRSAPLPATHEMITKWKSPTQGIRVHVNADETVEVVNFCGAKSVGPNTIHDALDSTLTVGNERSVLLTSDSRGWDSAVKLQVVSLLFDPSVQIYIAVSQ